MCLFILYMLCYYFCLLCMAGCSIPGAFWGQYSLFALWSTFLSHSQHLDIALPSATRWYLVELVTVGSLPPSTSVSHLRPALSQCRDAHFRAGVCVTTLGWAFPAGARGGAISFLSQLQTLHTLGSSKYLPFFWFLGFFWLFGFFKSFRIIAH